jgi:hypothetical protein
MGEGQWTGSEPGKVSTVRRYRCASCEQTADQESASGYVSTDLANRWMREEGWSFTKDGWFCGLCKAKRKALKL